MMHFFRFEMDSKPCESVTVKATCFTNAIKQFCLIFGDILPMSYVKRIVKFK